MVALVNSADTDLRARARRVIPGGLWGHMNGVNLPEGYPQYFASAEGCRLTDVDGRTFVDLMCAWGPIVLGHRHAAVEAAVREQAARGDCMNGPGPILVELAELLVEMLPHADWCQFGKNGTDATTGCVTIARAGTGRRKVLVARGAYHGAVPWCSPSVAGVTAEDRAHLLHYTYNDIGSVDAAVAQAGGDLAAVVVSAFRHDFGFAQELPTMDFARHVRSVCDATGAVLVLDDVRAGFRLDLGGSWEPLGVRPDLSGVKPRKGPKRDIGFRRREPVVHDPEARRLGLRSDRGWHG
jgi:glutamate-1-semialdehyde 2,1-aminomutase